MQAWHLSSNSQTFMFRIQSKIDTQSPEFIKNKEAYLKVLNSYKDVLKSARKGGPEQAVEKHCVFII